MITYLSSTDPIRNHIDNKLDRIISGLQAAQTNRRNSYFCFASNAAHVL